PLQRGHAAVMSWILTIMGLVASAHVRALPPPADRRFATRFDFAYFAAVTMISTRALGSASLASMQARAGRFFGSTQALQTSFISARLRMSVTQMVACSTFDLFEPHFASRRSMSSRICLVWPFTSWSMFLATMPARYTVSPYCTAWDRMAVGS